MIKGFFQLLYSMALRTL